MLPVYLDCTFLIASSVFSRVYYTQVIYGNGQFGHPKNIQTTKLTFDTEHVYPTNVYDINKANV